MISTETLIQKLAQSGLGDPKKIEGLQQEARKLSRSPIRLLYERELVPEVMLTDFLSDHLEIPALPLASFRVTKETLRLVPKKIAERHRLIPLARINNLLTVAVSDPFDVIARDDLEGITRCHVVYILASPKGISQALDAYYGESSNMESLLEGIDEESIEIIHQKEAESDAKAGQVSHAASEEAPVIRMVNLILDRAIRMRASDIHFEPYEKSFRVRYRIDGALKESFSHSRDFYDPLVARVKIMGQVDITEKRLPQDGRFRVSIQDREIDFRLSVLPTYHGPKVVLRVLDKAGVKSGLQHLGFSEKPTRIFAEAIRQPYGMILVTGPTGSGKSTTLYTILNTMNTPERNIMTVEDPVEYQVEGITQTQVHADVGLTFASGLRSLLRQSPDIVLVGEIRDSETADIGVKAALTGHLVFSTLHTNSAAGAMTRLVDMGVEPFLIASSVICVAAQRLMRKVCTYCKAPYQIAPEVLRRAKISAKDLEGVVCYRGTGCAKCHQSGYHGRMATIEVLRMNPTIRELVIQRKSSDVIEKVAIEHGMETLFENAFELFKKGLTTLEEVLRVTSQE